MRPAVWAMISCSFSSLTRNVAFGSSSVTTPGNSNSSSLAIRCPELCDWEHALARSLGPAKIGAERSGIAASKQPPARRLRCASFVAATRRHQSIADTLHQLITHGTIAFHALLAVSLRVGG